MKAKGTTTYWGTEEAKPGEEDMPEQTKMMMGCCKPCETHDLVREEMMKLPIKITAREYIQYKVDEGGKEKLPMPRRQAGKAPEDINVYTDGSLQNPTSRHWQVGGMGIYWPDRKFTEHPLEEHEAKYTDSEQQQHGAAMCGVFTALRGSSTRCEIATAIIAMLIERPVHIGADSLALVKKGTVILEHQRQRNGAKLKEQNGALILGGTTSHLHRESPWKQRWKLMKDGDTWKVFYQSAAVKNPEAVKLSKVRTCNQNDGH